MHTCTVQGWHTGIAHRYGTHVWHTGMESLLMAHWYGRQLWYTDIHGAPTWHTCMVQRYGTLMANKYGTQIRYTGMAQRYITQWMAQREGGSNGRGKGVRSNTMDPEGTEDSKGRGFGMREGTVGKGGGQPYAFGSAKNRTARQAHDPSKPTPTGLAHGESGRARIPKKIRHSLRGRLIRRHSTTQRSK
jgi:hypothetical protein